MRDTVAAREVRIRELESLKRRIRLDSERKTPLPVDIQIYTLRMDEGDQLGTSLPHVSWGAPHCRGNLNDITLGEHREIVCDECGHVVCRLAAADLRQPVWSTPVLTTIPHSSLGATDCCGCFDVTLHGNETQIISNKCDTLISTVPMAVL